MASKSKYQQFLFQFLKRLHAPLHFSKSPFPSRHAPGIEQLLNSIESGSFERKTQNYKFLIEEWNPLSQRIFVSGRFANASRFESDFLSIYYSNVELINIIHEALHVFLLEPFFTGTCNLTSARQTERLFLRFEAFCFWYSDIILTPRLREASPDGEFVLSRNAVSQAEFHPYRALKALKKDSRKESFQLYYDSFSGVKTALATSQVSESRVLAKRIYTFYESNKRSPRLLYGLLKKTQVFGEFYDRFCSVAGIPSLLTAGEARKLIRAESEDLWEAYSTTIPRLSKLSKTHIARVRMRRAIQTRAYSMYQLLYTLKNRAYFCANSKGFDDNRMISDVNTLLDTLEGMLNLCVSEPARYLDGSLISKWDRDYNSRVRKILHQAEVFAAQRALLYPPRYGKDYWIGLSSKGPGIQPDFTSTVSLIKNHILPLILSEKHIINSELLARVSVFLKLSNNVKKENVLLKKMVDQILRDEQVLPLWSSQLSSIDPRNNRFDETLFVYR